jgi:hypothetical protein
MTVLNLTTSLADNYIVEDYPADNCGTIVGIYVGDASNVPTDSYRTLISFDLSSIPSSAIISAVTLSLYESTASDTAGTGSWAVNLQRLLCDWSETASDWTHTNSGTPTHWATAGAANTTSDISSSVSATVTLDGTAAAGYIAWSGATLLDDVQKIVNGTYTNYGWRLAAPTAEQKSGYSYNAFYSKDNAANKPKLDVTYTVGWAHISKVKGATAANIAKDKGVLVAAISKKKGVAV